MFPRQGCWSACQTPRLPNVESILADVSPDAERVQNEGFILQSRGIAKEVIDKLKLRQNPEFNPELHKPSPCPGRRLRGYLPSPLTAWIAQLSPTKPAAPIDADRAAANRATTAWSTSCCRRSMSPPSDAPTCSV